MGSCFIVETKMISQPKTLQDIFPKKIIHRQSKASENLTVSEKPKMAFSNSGKVHQVPFLKPLGDNKLYKTRFQNAVASLETNCHSVSMQNENFLA